MSLFNQKIINKFISFLKKQSPPKVWLIVISSIMIIGWLDWITGYDFSLSLFYLFPVSIATWILGKKTGIVFSVISAIVWLIINYLSSEKYIPSLFYLWNTLIRFGFFIIVTFLLAELHYRLEIEKSLARKDFLTGTLNRRAFYDILQTEIMRSYRYQHPFTLVYIDLDGFKAINDTLGHSTGDILLKTVAKVIIKHIRNIDQLARLGGDEFAILLIETDSDLSQKIVNRLQTFLLEEMQNHQWNVTFSMGVMTYFQFPTSLDEVIKLADQLMYSVKSSGKNNIEYAIYHKDHLN